MSLGDEHFEPHIRSRSVCPPKTLYKYTSADTARMVLTARKLRYQSPLNYNDPFDSQWDALWFDRTPAYVKKERAKLDRALRDPSTWPSDMDPEFRAELAAELSQINALPTERERKRERNTFLNARAERPEIRAAAKEYVLDLRQRMRVLCLCESDRSMLMWSHYADLHRGVVIGFDAEKYEQACHRPFEQVTYSAALPMLFDADAYARAMIFGLPTPTLKDYRPLFLTKSQCWEYEREWRFAWVAPKGTVGEHQDFDLPPDALVEVVFGCRTDPRAMEELTELARAIQPTVRVASVLMHPARFELVKQPTG